MSAAYARVPRVWRALFATKLRSFSVEKRAIFALKFWKIRAIAAADARRTPTKRSDNHFMHAVHGMQVCLSSAVLSAPTSAEKRHDSRVKSESRTFRSFEIRRTF